MKLIFTSFILFLFIFSFVSAEITIESNQIMITSSNDRFLKNNQGALFFNVFNSTGDILTNSNTNCFINIFNSSNIVLSSSANYKTGSFYKNLTSNIYSKEGIYNYVFYCNSTTQSGFTNNYFEVTSSNSFSLFNSGERGLALVIAILGVLFLLTIIMLNIGKEHFLFSFFLIFIILFSMTMLPVLFLGNFNPTNLLKAISWVFRIFIIYVFVYIIYKFLLKEWANKVKTRIFKK